MTSPARLRQQNLRMSIKFRCWTPISNACELKASKLGSKAKSKMKNSKLEKNNRQNAHEFHQYVDMTDFQYFRVTVFQIRTISALISGFVVLA